jgi:hypothetical protein
MVVGIIFRFKQDYIAVLFSGLYLSLQILWPYYSGIRYIFPIFPFFIYFSFEGTKAVISKFIFLKQNYQTVLVSAFWGTIRLIFFLSSARLILINLYYDRTIQGPFDSYSSKMFDYIKQNTAEDDVIIFFKPRVMKLMAGRSSLLIKNCDEFFKGDYIVYIKEEHLKEQLSESDFAACQLDLTLIHVNENFKIFEINH